MQRIFSFRCSWASSLCSVSTPSKITQIHFSTQITLLRFKAAAASSAHPPLALWSLPQFSASVFTASPTHTRANLPPWAPTPLLRSGCTATCCQHYLQCKVWRMEHRLSDCKALGAELLNQSSGRTACWGGQQPAQLCRRALLAGPPTSSPADPPLGSKESLLHRALRICVPLTPVKHHNIRLIKFL